MSLRKVHFVTILLGLSMLATGASGLVSEYILCTVSTYILGNSIVQFTIIIALMMMMMGVGGYVQKHITDKSLIEKFITLETVLAILCGFAPIVIYTAYGHLNEHFPLVQYFFVTAIGFLVGFEIPLVLRINENYSENLKVNVAWIFGLDYIGAFIGALFWLWLLKRLPLTEISFVVAGINFFVAVITFSYFMKLGLVKHRVKSGIMITIALVLLIAGFTQNRNWEIRSEQKLYEDKIVFAKTTHYQHLVMTHSPELDDYRLYINGNLQFSSYDEYIYHELLVHPVMEMAGRPKKVLVLGGGDGLALREILKYPEVELVTLVDLDPEMTKLSANNKVMRKLNKDSFHDAGLKVLEPSGLTSTGTRPVFIENEKEIRKKRQTIEEVEEVARVDIINLDADKFIGNINGQWDVIIIDFPDPNAIELAKLYSKEFYTKLQKILSPQGFFVVQSTSPYHAKEAYLCILRTINAAGWQTLPFHENVPSFGDWGYVMGWRWDMPKQLVEDKLNNISFHVKTRYLTPAVFERARIFGKDQLVAKHDEINTLMQPNILTYYEDESWKNF